jgi:hypothetical protein
VVSGETKEEIHVDLKRLTERAKELVDKRGGTDALKEDAEELKGIATGSGSLGDKAKAAAEALKDPGASAADAASAPEAQRAEQKVEGEERGKHAGGGQRGKRGGGRHGRGGRGRGRL